MKNTFKFISDDQLNSFCDNHKIQSEVIQIPIKHIPDIKYNLEFVNKINKINDPINAELVLTECINQYVQELHIYTDGSKQLDNTVSSAIYIYTHQNLTLKYQIEFQITVLYIQQNYPLYI